MSKGTQITPAFYDPNLDEHLTLVGQCIKNAAGLWVPVSTINPMPTFGVVGIDQTTQGVTNGVSIVGSLANGVTDALPVQLSGSTVSIGGVTYAVSGGDTLRNTSANKPDAAATHAVIPFCYYFSVDTGAIEVTNGTSWVVI